MERLKSVALLAGLTALVLFIGQAMGGKSGFLMALVFAGVMNVGAYWFSDKIILKMSGAKPLSQSEEPEIYDMVQELALSYQMPMPKLYLIPEQAPNAFATGRNPEHAAVAVTAGILELLDKNELHGVLAHELAHVYNRDTLVSTIAATLAGALSMIADMAFWGALFGGRDGEDRHPLVGLLGMMVAPMAGMLIQMGISRSREFMADATGATKADPLALASALQKIEVAAKRIPMHGGVPATASLYIINPFRGEQMLKLFSTHPPTRERVARLQKIAEKLKGSSNPLIRVR